MKTTISILAAILCVHAVSAQLKTTAACPTFSVDLLEGTINGLNAKSTIGEVKTTFPCFTKAVEETSGFECGGVFYKDRDISFFTERDYVEIGEKFKGKISQPFLGAARNSLFKWLGYPKVKDVNWDAFQTAYGILVLHYNKAGKINLIQFSKKSSETLSLCE